LPLGHSKLVQQTVDFAKLAQLPALQEAFVALGTTLKVAGSQAAFRAVDLDAVVTVARAARAAGAYKLGVVSAMGANAQSTVFYNRVKGEMEDAVGTLGFETLVIVRPSLLAGAREDLNQPARPGERLSLALMRYLAPMVPANYRAVDARKVAAGLLQSMHAGAPGQHVLLSGQLQRFQI
jgi:uncharacterized protein YbjT (DUF2867 family)